MVTERKHINLFQDGTPFVMKDPHSFLEAFEYFFLARSSPPVLSGFEWTSDQQEAPSRSGIFS